jgi:hypothetical protein
MSNAYSANSTLTPQSGRRLREDAHPWWRYGHVWLVLGLLTFAVAASCGLLYAALWISRTDTIYSDPLHPQHGSAPKVTQPNMLPAEEGRNFAVTGGIGAPGLKASAAAPAMPAAKANHGEGSPYAPVDD